MLKNPTINNPAFIAKNSTVIGDVTIGEGSSVWYQTVIRGDIEPIIIGKNTNIQELSSLHTSTGNPLVIGDEVTIGHNAVLHGCTIKDRVLVGMGSIVLDGAVLEEGAMLGAGSLVPMGKVIPSFHLALGSPAKVIRPLTDEEIAFLTKSAMDYVKEAKIHEEYQEAQH